MDQIPQQIIDLILSLENWEITYDGEPVPLDPDDRSFTFRHEPSRDVTLTIKGRRPLEPLRLLAARPPLRSPLDTIGDAGAHDVTG